MLVRPPLGELREVIDDLFAVRVEDVRTVLVIQDSSLVRLVIGIAADMLPPIDQQDARAMLACQPFREDGTGKARTDDQIIVSLARRFGGAEESVHSAATISADAF